jgi:probable F420-dependent oxidoreductase
MNEFGRYGVWVNRRLWPDNANTIAAAAQELEALGFGAVWIGGSPPDDLLLVESLLAATKELVVGTSIVDIWHSNGDALAATQHKLALHYPGRFVLGVGSGHAPAAEETGQAYVRPLTKLRDFVTGKLGSVPSAELMIAALGPKALEAARELTAGALPYLTPPEHTAAAREILGPSRRLVPEQKVFLGTDPATARAAARRRTTPYLSLPNYTTMLRRYGMTDEDLAGEGSDRFVDQAVVWGDAEAVRQGVGAHLAAGADHVALQVLSADPDDPLPVKEWRAIAEVLFG